jgi:hypothetical protein
LLAKDLLAPQERLWPKESAALLVALVFYQAFVC